MGVGYRNACGLRASGEIYCWGDNTYNQLEVPDHDDWVSLSVANTHNKSDYNSPHFSCGLRETGEAFCWGSTQSDVSTVPSIASDLSWTKIQAGNKRGFGELSDGSLIVWGNNASTMEAAIALPAGQRYKAWNARSAFCGILPSGLMQCFNWSGEDISDEVPRRSYAVDNCMGLANADQTDSDDDGYGDACDSAPNDSGLH
jgi:hypothetical protein